MTFTAAEISRITRGHYGSFNDPKPVMTPKLGVQIAMAIAVKLRSIGEIDEAHTGELMTASMLWSDGAYL